MGKFISACVQVQASHFVVVIDGIDDDIVSTLQIRNFVVECHFETFCVSSYHSTCRRLVLVVAAVFFVAVGMPCVRLSHLDKFEIAETDRFKLV